MSEVAVAAERPPHSPSKNLLARLAGVLFSPRETYADIVAAPRWLGAMTVVVVVCAVALGIFLSTERGQALSLDQQITAMESMGFTVTDEMYAQLEARAPQAIYFAVPSQVIFLPLITLLVAAIAFGVFNLLLGGDATFQQVFAVAVYSNVVGMVALLFMLPLNYAREAMSNPANLSVFLPMLDEGGFAAMFLGTIDLFRLWWVVNLSIGLAVLYKRRTAPIAWSLIGVYVVIALGYAAVRTALGA